MVRIGIRYRVGALGALGILGLLLVGGQYLFDHDTLVRLKQQAETARVGADSVAELARQASDRVASVTQELNGSLGFFLAGLRASA